MNIEEINRKSQGEAVNDSTLAFRLPESDKQKLLEICDRDGLSVGRLLRAMVQEYVSYEL